ncbi:MAG: hypothetical protein Q7J73_00705 [Dehalococcoidales bacterium]|nr:hypothetical protein [Dehalococcoidales bacterium]
MIRVTIAGTEVNTSGIRIHNELTHTPDTCSFSLDVPASAPSSGQDVKCYLDTISGTPLFGGTIVSVRQNKLAPHYTPALRAYSYSVECCDYSRLINQILITETYQNKTSKQIIDDIVTNFTDPAHGFTTANVEISRVISEVVYNYIPVVQALSELADLLLWDWYIDANKDIHFFERESRSAPFLIDDTAVTSLINNFSLIPDYSQVRNRVYVRGGYYASSAYTQSIVADGQLKIWSLGFTPLAVSAFTIDSVAQTISQEYVGAGGTDFYWDSKEKYIRCATATPAPTAGQVLAITYTYEIPIIVRADNTLSQAAIAAIEGGNGIYESIIRDETITSRELAQDRAKAEVNQFGNVAITGGFTTYESGFVAGQFSDISVSGYTAFAGNYQIQRVVISAAGPHDELYQVVFASTLYELKDFLLSLVRAQARVKLREGEIVDVLKIINETITVSETVIISMTAHPIRWGEFKWGMATWG